MGLYMNKLISFLKINRSLGVSFLLLISSIIIFNLIQNYLIIIPFALLHLSLFVVFIYRMYIMQQEFRFSSTKLASFVFLSFLPLGSLMIDYDIKEEFFIKKPIWINLL